MRNFPVVSGEIKYLSHRGYTEHTEQTSGFYYFISVLSVASVAKVFSFFKASVPDGFAQPSLANRALADKLRQNPDQLFPSAQALKRQCHD